MTIDVSDAIDDDTAEELSVIRTTAGGYVDGIYVDGAETSFNSLISSQQPTPAEVQMLPSAERKKDIRKFISDDELFTDDDIASTVADQVIFRGFKYKLIKASGYQSYGYTRAFGARQQP